MERVGIIAAMQEEMKEIANVMIQVSLQEISGLKFLIGKINNTEVVLVEAGVGKVNAARTTQILLDNFEIDLIINQYYSDYLDFNSKSKLIISKIK